MDKYKEIIDKILNYCQRNADFYEKEMTPPYTPEEEALFFSLENAYKDTYDYIEWLVYKAEMIDD